jgi:hypothetical protein
VPKHFPLRLSKSGPVVDYLNTLHQSGNDNLAAQARLMAEATKRILETPDGLIMLEMLENSTTNFFLHPEADARALDALNAQRFIALDLRRIQRDEIHAEPERKDLLERRGGRGRKP